MLRVLLLILLWAATAARPDPLVPAPAIAAKTWLLLDLQSQQIVAERAAQARIEPASLTKLMTAYVVFEALRQKEVSLSREVHVTTAAWKMPGSRMFLEADTLVPVEQLLRGMIVVSANDATIALAHGIAGSEEAFVDRMNAQAKRLGMAGSRFANATGLSDPQHYSTTYDLAVLANALIRDFPQYLGLYVLREFTFNGITQPNRNSLLGWDPRVDGLKTGYTENAGYCLIATARRDARRLLAIVTGAESEKARATEAQRLLNYGFQHYETLQLYAQGAEVAQLPVWKGSQKRLKAGMERDLFLSVPRGQGDRLKATLTSQQPLLAPISRLQRVGVLRITFDGKPVGEYPVVALEAVSVANMLIRAWDSLRLLFD
jgi:serine-type D-Ala-D-Ala carboxypeptidase (penicillin-binding protein 5/6)